MKMLGEIAAFKFPKGLEVSFGTLRQALKDTGNDESIVRSLAPSSAFTRACRKLAAGRIVRVLEHTQDELRFQFTREYASGGELAYAKQAILTLDKHTNAVMCSEIPALAQEAQNLLGKCLDARTTGDLTRVVRAVIERGGADVWPFVERSGVYFVDVSQQATLNRALNLAVKLGGHVRRLAVPDVGGETARSVKEVVREGLEKLVREHEEAVAAFDPEAGERALENAVERVKVTKLKLEAYAEYIAGEKQNLEARLKKQEEVLRQRILSLSGAGGFVQEPQLAGVA